MNRQVLQLHVNRQAEQQAADAEQQSDRQKVMSVQAAKMREIHGPQIRKLQAGFTSARLLRLPVSQRRQQQRQQACSSSIRPIQKHLCALHDGRGYLPHLCHPNLRTDYLPRKKRSHDERQDAHASKEVHPTQYSHTPSNHKVLKSKHIRPRNGHLKHRGIATGRLSSTYTAVE